MITKSEYLNDEKILRGIDFKGDGFFRYLKVKKNVKKKSPARKLSKDYNDFRVLKIYIPKQQNSVMLG